MDRPIFGAACRNSAPLCGNLTLAGRLRIFFPIRLLELIDGCACCGNLETVAGGYGARPTRNGINTGDMSIKSILDGNRQLEPGRVIDDNLKLVRNADSTRICCRHCGQMLGDENNLLYVGIVQGESRLAGPSVRSDPSLFVDVPVAFTQHVCPTCGTAIQTSVPPKSEILTISGFAVA